MYFRLRSEINVTFIAISIPLLQGRCQLLPAALVHTSKWRGDHAGCATGGVQERLAACDSVGADEIDSRHTVITVMDIPDNRASRKNETQVGSCKR